MYGRTDGMFASVNNTLVGSEISSFHVSTETGYEPIIY